MALQRSNNHAGKELRALATAPVMLLLPVSAYLMARAIESPNLWWLGWITLLPLLQCIRVLGRGPAMLAGATWGLCLFLFATLFAHTRIAPTVASCALLTVVPGAYAYFGAALTARIGFSPFLLALGWIGVEFALGPLGLRQGLLAGTQGDGLVIRLIGSAAGYALVAFLVAYVNASLLSVLTGVRRGGADSRLIRGSGDVVRPYFSAELPSYLLHLSRSAQPRAPPA